jgi:hypothetical protein
MMNDARGLLDHFEVVHNHQLMEDSAQVLPHCTASKYSTATAAYDRLRCIFSSISLILQNLHNM